MNFYTCSSRSRWSATFISESAVKNSALSGWFFVHFFFYGWWNPKYVSLLVGSLLFNYYLGLALRDTHRKILLTLGVAANLVLLGYYKYAGFFTSIYTDITGSSVNLGNIILPLGISFFTFQQIAWLVDSYQNKISSEDKGLWEYGLFVTFFPQFIAGPIVHHSEMMPQFYEDKNRAINWNNIAAGLSIFVVGLSKKVVIADSIAPYANQVFDAAMVTSNVISSGEAWIAALAYTMQLYFDFSGYADMAIGLALMCNIRLPVNFDSPYKATTIADFWRRWHISLSRFLKDYLFIPLGGSRVGEYRLYTNLFLTMLIGGLWHGAGWTFVFWGGLHGLYLAINKLWNRLNIFTLPDIFAQALTFLSVIVAWVFFRAETFDSAATLVRAMFDIGKLNIGEVIGVEQLPEIALYLISATLIALFLPNTQNLFGEKNGGIEVYKNRYRALPFFKPTFRVSRLWFGFSVFLAISSIYFLLDQTSVQEFIYFQF